MIRNKPFSKRDQALVGLVTTPIGNLDDITLRALNFLKEADIIACEDTRNTSLLLSHYGIKGKKLVSLYAQNELENGERILKEVQQNKLKLAYCSDAGMPGISDPGALLVHLCYQMEIPVTVLPGATASLTALVLSGFDSADFTFYGFLPNKEGQIKTFLKGIKDRKETMIFYESPKRYKKTLNIMAQVFSDDRECSVIRELTKIHEEVVSGTLKELLNTEIEERGEIVLIVKGNDSSVLITDEEILKEVKELLKKGDKSLNSLSKELAERYKIPKKRVYEIGLSLK